MNLSGRYVLLLIFIGLLFFMKQNCFCTEMNGENSEDFVNEYYNEFLEQNEISEIDNDLSGIITSHDGFQTISFEEIMKLLFHGQVDLAIEKTFENFYKEMFSEVLLNRELIVHIILLIIIASVFHNYSSLFRTSYIGEQGFYITYLLISVMLLQSFTLVYDISWETICYIRDLMQCMLPAFYLSLIMCTGLTTSQMVNSMFIAMLTFTEKILLDFILPAIRIYFLIVLLNQINKEDRFSKLAGLLKQGICFVLKTITTAIIGLNVVKSMLVPVYENAKYNVVQKGLSLIPGGASLSGLTSILVGAGILIKNSVGITVVLILLVCTGIPLVKMLSFFIVYKILVAVVQPISDKRILSGIQGICDSTGILLRATTTSVVLSVLSIAIVILTTNVRT